jgi:hypothetical protein
MAMAAGCSLVTDLEPLQSADQASTTTSSAGGAGGTGGADGGGGSAAASGGAGEPGGAGPAVGGGGAGAGGAGAGGGSGGSGGCPDADGDMATSAACGGPDCDDGDPSVFPGQTMYFASPSSALGTFDYDCDGSIARDPAQLFDGTGNVQCIGVACQLAEGFAADAECGGLGEHYQCTPPLCTLSASAASEALRCR